MSKSRVSELTNVYEHLLRDAGYAFPTLEMEFERDLVRLKRLVEQRGISTLLIDLPAVGKHFDRCLSAGEYNLSGLPLTKRRSPRELTPKFLGGLFLLVFDESGRLRSSPDVEAIFFIRQLCYVFKKAEFTCEPEKTLQSVEEFARTDAALPIPERYWLASTPLELTEAHEYGGFHSSEQLTARAGELPTAERRKEVSAALKMLDAVSSVLASDLGAYTPSDWRFRHGPGAIAETTDTVNKYSWRNWSDILEDGYPMADCAFHSVSAWASHGECHQVPSVVPEARLLAVPKSYKGPRLIAAEPSEHQWCQQNAKHYFSDRTGATLLGRFVSFRDQTLNQRLCVQGSRNGATATLDLSEASDRMTCHVVGQFFRGNPGLLRCLRASRTRRIKQSINRKVDQTFELRKFSTMGSACTFPVQSAVFCGMVIAAVLTHRRWRPTPKNIRRLEGEVAVFGDDIIVPSDCRALLVDLLEVCYFKVNTHKSYWTGKFRESCGVDSFDGNTVTPIYWKQEYRRSKPESLASVVECANNFYKKWLLHTAAYLASTVPRDVPQAHVTSGVFGLKTRFRPRNPNFRVRTNRGLQRVEILVRSISASQVRSPTNDDTALLQYFTERPSPQDKWVHGVMQRPRLKSRRTWVPLSAFEASHLN